MIYIDRPREYPTKLRYKVWSHLHSDTSVEELHAFAEKLGLKRHWFQPKPVAHYDVTESKYRQAISLGAKPVTAREGLQKNFEYRTWRATKEAR